MTSETTRHDFADISGEQMDELKACTSPQSITSSAMLAPWRYRMGPWKKRDLDKNQQEHVEKRDSKWKKGFEF